MEAMSCPIMDPEEYKSVHTKRELKEIMALVEKRNRTLLRMSKAVKKLPRDGSFDQFDYLDILQVVEMKRDVADITEKLHVE